MFFFLVNCQKDFELSQCNAELSKARRCLDEKKEDLKERNLEFHRLRSEYDRLKQTSGRAQPQVNQVVLTLFPEKRPSLLGQIIKCPELELLY